MFGILVNTSLDSVPRQPHQRGVVGLRDCAPLCQCRRGRLCALQCRNASPLHTYIDSDDINPPWPVHVLFSHAPVPDSSCLSVCRNMKASFSICRCASQ
eukprot:1870229-Pleurochrysis_carterae.AAC.3